MPFSFLHLLTWTGLPCMQVVVPWCSAPENVIAVPVLGALPLKSRLYVSPVFESISTRQEVSTAFTRQPEPLTVLGFEGDCAFATMLVTKMASAGRKRNVGMNFNAASSTHG